MKRAIVLLSLVVTIFSVQFIFAEGILDPKLSQKMSSESGPFQVIVTFKALADVGSLSTLGVNYLALNVLPMAGAVMTASQVNQVLQWETVESIYFNERLRYFNNDAGRITGAHEVQALGFSGRDKTIVVLDSGIDATHPDLQFGPKVIQNVKVIGDLGLTGTAAFVEGVINTDNTSGHGTHVAGTVGGTGSVSADDERNALYYRGVAPGSRLVGIGAGETLLILHALISFDYAIANRDRYGINVITNSWGNTNSQFDPNNPINRASYEAYRQGIVVTFAAGNEGPDDNTMSTYAISPWVIGVAAGTKTKALADFSSRGESGDQFEHPDITAPGVGISSTRAVGTPVGALGPVVNVNHPEYYTYYHTISGTSMATPFVAGSVALLLEANSQLSPDQIEDILVTTSDPMSAYAAHQVGGGYINVKKAVELAQTTTGNRIQFLAGDTKWASQGNWPTAEENNANLAYAGKWQSLQSSSASDGTYTVGSVETKGKKVVRRPYLSATFFGTSIKLGYLTTSSGGTGEVLIDGISHGTVNFYSDATTWNLRAGFGGLTNTRHTFELRGLTGKIYVDRIYVDGQLFPAGTQFVEETESWTGTLGPSVEGIPETRLIPVEVGANTIQLGAELSWSGGVDVDLYLLDPQGVSVASSASLDNPEAFSYWVTSPGSYTYKIVGYATVVADYTLKSTQTKAVSGVAGQSNETTAIQGSGSARSPSFSLAQNYPNPFNPETNISYVLPSEGFVTVRVYNLLGVEVGTLVQRQQSEGEHKVTFNGRLLPSGVYFFKVELTDSRGGSFSKVQRMSLLK